MIGWYQLVHEWQIEVQIHYPYLTRTRPRNWKLLSKQLLARQWAVQNFTIQIILLMFQNPCTTWDVFQTLVNNGSSTSLNWWVLPWISGCHQHRYPLRQRPGPNLGRCHFPLPPGHQVAVAGPGLALVPPSRLLRQGNPETGSAAKISSFCWALLVGNMFIHIYIYLYLAPNMGQTKIRLFWEKLVFLLMNRLQSKRRVGQTRCV